MNIEKHINKLASNEYLEEYQEDLTRYIQSLGFDQYTYFAVPCTVDEVTNKAFCLTNNQPYLTRYIEQGYAKHDPIMLAGLDRSQASFKWNFLDKNKFSCIEKHSPLPTLTEKYIVQQHDCNRFTNWFESSIKESRHSGYSFLLNNSVGITAGCSISSQDNKVTNSSKYNKLKIFVTAFHYHIQKRFAYKFTDHLLPKLSPAENMLLREVVQGYKYKEVCFLLNKKMGTIRSQLNSIRRRLKAKNIPHACAIASELNMLTPFHS